MITYSQENSPFSRYGIGDIYPQQNIASRGMGGFSVASTNSQAINTINPASYGSLGLVTYDFALTIDVRSLMSATPVSKYKSTNFIPSYLQIGVPINKKGLGMAFGLRPATRINYSVKQDSIITYDDLTTDNMVKFFDGNGGLNQVFLGFGKTWRSKKKSNNGFSVGVNGGYEWGTKFTSTKINFPDHPTENWYASNSTDSTHYGGFFLMPGLMLSLTMKERTDPVSKIKDSYVLVLGGSGTLEQNLSAKNDITRQTYFLRDDGLIVPVDSIYKESGIKGEIHIPLTFNGGFMLNKMVANGPFEVKKWGIGVEYNFTPWSEYRYFGLPDRVNDSWMIRGGIEWSPNPFSSRSVFGSGIYRIGYYNGKDYINADGNGYKVQAFTVGYSFNLRRYHSYDKQFTMINTAVEFGKRGSDVNNITENFIKFSLGLSLSDIWFIKRKYD
ncbi:MAG TPA: hypothetical protein VFW07_24345 [Parafilimonas sp.]|nr:hypothetical protein [Parafilimonas sp.]